LKNAKKKKQKKETLRSRASNRIGGKNVRGKDLDKRKQAKVKRNKKKLEGHAQNAKVGGAWAGTPWRGRAELTVRKFPKEMLRNSKSGANRDQKGKYEIWGAAGCRKTG